MTSYNWCRKRHIMRKITIHRLKKFNGCTRTFYVKAHDEKVAELKNGETKTIEVTEGRVVLEIGFGPLKSEIVRIKEGTEDLELTVHISPLSGKIIVE